MNLAQTLRRMGQQSKNGWIKSTSMQSVQLKLIEKLYLNNGLTLKLTCSSCPEQYDVLDLMEQVAYIRLRHGYFTVTMPGVGGKDILCEYPNGERLVYMTKALRAIKNNLNQTPPCTTN